MLELARAKYKHFEVLDGLRTHDSGEVTGALQADIARGENDDRWAEEKAKPDRGMSCMTRPSYAP